MSADGTAKNGGHRPLDVLIVDDDPMIGLLLQGGLDVARFSVSVALSGREAICMCDASGFDLVVLDYQMPGTSGLEVARVLRRKKIPFVMLSAFVDSRIEQRAARRGALAYLVKPVTPKQVELAIDTAVARAEEINSLERAAKVSGIVGVAAGLVMGALGSSRMQALNILRAICRPRNQTLKDLSLEVTNVYEIRLMSSGPESAYDALRKYLDTAQTKENE
jgi:DNA-binding response OmpR family regulator